MSTIPPLFIVMLDYGTYGAEAITTPELTRAGIVSRIASGEWAADRVLFVLHIHDGVAATITSEIIAEAEQRFYARAA